MLGRNSMLVSIGEVGKSDFSASDGDSQCKSMDIYSLSRRRFSSKDRCPHHGCCGWMMR